ncbi:hypothetical protein DXB18_11750 [Clostridium sp. OM02-18AC]|mgnify:CR=1 FL=1|uniref:hypothetical protein n=1 Tax=Clostridium sp. OM02-18AC TaxID=2292311 RepID=UPI000E4F5D0B|nr:hypothetical protein [Clostridium sp. OM02-18AC]RHV64406.1 hypothetical protein DXB18_11750 [Clostridium sp. OM02-18AC]
MAEKVCICEDVTRDGFQSADRIIRVEDKLTILEMLADAGVQQIEVGAFSKYESMKKMRNTGELSFMSLFMSYHISLIVILSSLPVM